MGKALVWRAPEPCFHAEAQLLMVGKMKCLNVESLGHRMVTIFFLNKMCNGCASSHLYHQEGEGASVPIFQQQVFLLQVIVSLIF